MINIGVVGIGLSAELFHLPLIKQVEGIQIAAVLTSKKYQDVFNLLGDVAVFRELGDFSQSKLFDVAIVLTPNHLHFEACRALIEAGKHVIVDKPFTVHTEEALTLKKLAEKHDRLVTVFHNRRWDDDFLTIQQLIQSNGLGDITYFESRFDKFLTAKGHKWKAQNLPGAGRLYDIVPHIADQVFLLFGMPQTVYAQVRCDRKFSEVDDYFKVSLIYPDKEVVLRSSSVNAYSPFRFYVEGQKATFFCHTDIDTSTSVAALQDQDGKHDVEIITGNHSAFYKDLRNAITEKLPTLVTIDDAISINRLIDKVLESSNTNQVVKWSS